MQGIFFKGGGEGELETAPPPPPLPFLLKIKYLTQKEAIADL